MGAKSWIIPFVKLLKIKGYTQASLAVQKKNYAVKMYKNVGFEIIDENNEEYIMLCKFWFIPLIS